VGKIQVTGRYHHLPKRLEDDYSLSGKVLGSGYNGQVFLATNKTNGEKVAVKGFKLIGVSKAKKEELESECEIFLAMDHPHVARLVDVYEDEERLNLVMECMTGGELFKRVVERKYYSEKDAAEAAWQMLLAVNYIHKHGIVHRDIKLENFLYEAPGSDHLKLIDFGFSKIWEQSRKMALSCGTLAYVAPEVLAHSYTSQCDMWSLGVTIFIVVFGYMPFSGSEEKQVGDIRAGKYSVKKDVWKRVSAKGQDFVKKMLEVNPHTRMTPEQALAHEWIANREKMKSEALDQGIVDALSSFGQASAFRRACMSMMAWSLSAEERARVRDAFLEMDTQRTGTITMTEFKEVMEKKFAFEDTRIKEMFVALDTNHTDEIHYTEFLAAMVSTRLGMHDNLLKQTFKRFDVDNSGYITVENLKEVLGETFEGNEIEQLIKEADFKGDGRISYEEWIQYIKNGAVVDDKHQRVADRLVDIELAKAEKQGHIQKFMRMHRPESAPSLHGSKHRPEAKDKEKQPKCGCVLS